jgi:hypothetical protein
MAESFAQFESRTRKFIRELENEKLKAMATKAGVEAKKLAERAASADLGGDPKFSGWAPKLETRFDHLEPGTISFKPTKRSAGPWTVAEFGRNQAAGPRMVGPRLTKTGKVSKARTKRYNGQTQGKDTASDALELIDKSVPKIVDREVTKAVRKFFN